MLRAKWSAKEKENLKIYHNQGLNDIQIGAKLGRSPKAISIQRGRVGAVKFHIEREKGIPAGPRKSPRPGRMPDGAQIVLEDFLPKLSRENAIQVNEAFFGKEDTRRTEKLKGNEEIYPGPSISRTIHSDVGLDGTINIYNHDGETEYTLINLAPRNAISILAAIISKLVRE